MINIDSFGLGATPLALEGSSSKKLLQAADDVAKAMPVPFSKLRINGADSDSSSFIARNIPAITLSGVSEDWQSILHTTKDQVGMVKPENVYLGYRFALALAARVDEAACDSYR
jgi:hypothetical protein